MKDLILMAVILVVLGVVLAAAVMISFYTASYYCRNTSWYEIDMSRCVR